MCASCLLHIGVAALFLRAVPMETVQEISPAVVHIVMVQPDNGADDDTPAPAGDTNAATDAGGATSQENPEDTPVEAATEKANTSPVPDKPVAREAPPKPAPTPTPTAPVRTAQPSPRVAVAAPETAEPSGGFPLLGPAQLAGAQRAGMGHGAGSGAGSGNGAADGSVGGGAGGTGRGTRCDMAERLQALVRRDAAVQTLVRDVHRRLSAEGKAIHIWDGEWIQSRGEEGRGLAGLRQALAVEVAFAPRECRMQPVRGLVVLTLGDGPNDPKLALGTASWRWGELAVR